MPKFLIVLLILSIFSYSAESQPFMELDSADYFNFWEGKWEATWDEGEKKGRGINELSWVMGGKVLQEDFRIVEGQSKGFIGGSFSVFQPQTNTWRQAWADNQGGYYDFIGDFQGEKRIFKTHPREVNSQIIIQRMVFYDIKVDSFMWDWELSRDGGETWSLSWRISYQRSDG